MRLLILIILLATVSNAFSQDWPVRKMVAEKKQRKIPFVRVPSFSLAASKQLQQRGTYQVLRLNSTFIKQLFEQRPEATEIAIPVNGSEVMVCELVRFKLGNIKYTENNKEAIQNIKEPVTYRGIVSGEQEKNNVILTVNEDYLSLIAVTKDKTIQITKADEENKSVYRLYNSKEIQFPAASLVCGTQEKSSSKLVNDIQTSGFQKRTSAPQDKCVSVFVDCFDSLYQWRGSSTQQTINYVYELFNLVSSGYYNEQINIQISTINVWTAADPYRGDNRENALADLSANYKDDFWGNICVGLDFSINSPVGGGRSGLAGDIGRVKGVAPNTCPAYTVKDHPFCYNDLNYNVSVQNFPTGPNTTQQQVYLVMHEMGHLLGAHHTKWCGWKLTSNPDTYGALDSCGGMESIDTTKPTCPPGPAPPASGATIMSYCVSGNTANDFANYNNGFGALPGGAVRTFIDQTTCIPECLECLIVLNSQNDNAYALKDKPPQYSYNRSVTQFALLNIDAAPTLAQAHKEHKAINEKYQALEETLIKNDIKLSGD